MIAPVNRSEEAALAIVGKLASSESSVSKSDPDVGYLAMRNQPRFSASENRLTSLLPERTSDEPMLMTNRLAARQNASQPDPNQYVGASAEKGIIDAVMKELPNIVDEQFKDNLRALSEYAKAKPPTPAQEDRAAEAFNHVSREFRLSLNKAVITLGITAALSDKLGVTMAGTVASIAAKPLAQASLMIGDTQFKMVMFAVNKALSVVGMKPIEEKDQTLFMAKTVGDFADDILARIEQKEKGGAYQATVKAQAEQQQEQEASR